MRVKRQNRLRSALIQVFFKTSSTTMYLHLILKFSAKRSWLSLIRHLPTELQSGTYKFRPSNPDFDLQKYYLYKLENEFRCDISCVLSGMLGFFKTPQKQFSGTCLCEIQVMRGFFCKDPVC